MNQPSVSPALASTLVLGASTNPSRYANIAIHMLRDYGHPVVALGSSPGMVEGIPIQTSVEELDPTQPIDTVTLYLGVPRQAPLEDWLLKLKPRRVIFNPGTENPAFIQRLREAGIEPVIACTLVMLRTQQY